MKDVLAGRVDLVRALASGGAELQEAAAHLLGFERQEEKPPPPREIDAGPEPLPEPPPEVGAAQPRFDVPFWQARDFTAREPRPGDEPPAVELAPRKRAPVRLPPAALASGAAILTRLRNYAAFSDLRGGVDLDRTVARLSKGHWLRQFPRRPRKRWGQAIQVIGDRSRRLAPFWLDQDFAITQLKRVYPQVGFQLAILEDGASVPRNLLPSGQAGSYRPPEPGTVMLVLGDLGCLARQQDERERLANFWLDWGRRLRASGNPALALVPCHPGHCRGELSRLWTVLPWEGIKTQERPPLSEGEMDAVADQVLTRLAFALRVEPRLVRAVRHLLPDACADAGIESYVWQHGAFQSRHHEAATFDPDSMRSLLPEFFRLPEAERRRVYDLVRELRSEVYPGVWYSELLTLERDADRGLLDPSEIRQAARWYEQRSGHLAETGAANDPAANEPTWFRRVFARLSESVNQGSAARTLHAIWEVVRPDDRVENLPGFLDPALLPPSSNPERLIALRQAADRLVATPFPGNTQVGGRGTADREPPGSLLGLIRTRHGLIRIDRLDDFWEVGVPPEWATAWGWDKHGAWVSLRLEGAAQRLRWIPPGRFLMGSPEDEEGRFSDEGPRHEERIGTGFWLFDTPCTQALWEAVMEANPSQFKGPDRPVEQVSWSDCQEFVRRLNQRLPGLELGLPSEAQWEYACRAGTATARYHANLDEIAWYDENSGGETHPVVGKLPNGWGLYDMLGNVWEWCADPWREDYSVPRGEEPGVGASVPRVVRGGSWSIGALFARAAYRIRGGPSIRIGDLGFRCAEFKAPGPAGRSRDAERGGSGEEQGAEHRDDRAPASGAAWLRPGEGAGKSDSLPISVLASIRIATDLETLTIRPASLPGWASAIGRDRFGLWAEFTIYPPPPKRSRSSGMARNRRLQAPTSAPTPVRQRLRWIPPGRFLMGSPEDEDGHDSDEAPRHEETIKSGFWMFDTPCTQALWEAVLGANPSQFKAPDRPVERVSWDDCQEFVRRLNEHLAGLELSLPTEAQWEYACRAGTATARYHANLDEIAWYDENSGGETHPVVGKLPNGWGLYDMLGNVWEWCADPWREDHSVPRGEKPVMGASVPRVVRGGSWDLVARYARAACRYLLDPSNRDDSLGFRCAEFRSGS